MPPVFLLDHVSRSWRAGIPGCRAAVRVLEDASLRVAPGELVVVTGRPGSGITTLLLLAAGMLRPDGGQAWWRDGRERSRYLDPLSGTALAAAAADLVHAPPALLLVDRCTRPALAPRLDAVVGAALRRGAGVVLAAGDRDPGCVQALAQAHGARRVRLERGRLHDDRWPVHIAVPAATPAAATGAPASPQAGPARGGARRIAERV